MPVVHLVGETPDRAIQVARAIKGQSACLKPVLVTVLLDVPGNTSTRGINVHKTGNYPAVLRDRPAYRPGKTYPGHPAVPRRFIAVITPLASTGCPSFPIPAKILTLSEQLPFQSLKPLRWSVHHDCLPVLLRSRRHVCIEPGTRNGVINQHKQIFRRQGSQAVITHPGS